MKLKGVTLKNENGILSVDTIEYPLKPCEDCGQEVSDRRVQIRKNHSATQIAHYKIQCVNCKMYKNPVSGEYDCDRREIDDYYRIKNIQKRQKDSSFK